MPPQNRFFLPVFFILFYFAAFTAAQTPTPTPEADDKPEKVFTEEIKLNILAFDASGNFAAGVKKEDLVISEDGRLHQANSLRRVPANVLIVLDAGNEISYAKRSKTTVKTAEALISFLQAEDSIAVMQYGDKVEIIAEWTQDRAFLEKILDDKKLGVGRRSVFNQALNAAVKFFQKTPLENRHLILITDGVDSFNNQNQKDSALKNLLASDINVHVVSYTVLQQKAIEIPKTVKGGGTQSRTSSLPPGAGIPAPGQTRNYPILTINLDREMIKKRREQVADLKKSEAFLTMIAEDTNGEIFLPASVEEMIAKTARLAKTIDSHYILTYTPKRPLSESEAGETRIIEVSSRRPAVLVRAKRKLVVSAER